LLRLVLLLLLLLLLLPLLLPVWASGAATRRRLPAV
jgi:hypothetical protein